MQVCSAVRAIACLAALAAFIARTRQGRGPPQFYDDDDLWDHGDIRQTLAPDATAWEPSHTVVAGADGDASPYGCGALRCWLALARCPLSEWISRRITATGGSLARALRAPGRFAPALPSAVVSICLSTCAPPRPATPPPPGFGSRSRQPGGGKALSARRHSEFETCGARYGEGPWGLGVPD